MPEPFFTLLKEAYRDASLLGNINAGFRIFRSPVFNSRCKSICLENVSFNPGNTIFHALKKSSEIALFVATAGPEISVRIHDMTVKGDYAGSYVYDLVGSLVVMKSVQRLLEMAGLGTGTPESCVTHPYSPGNCGWEMAEQRKLFSLFPEGFCGVTLTGACLMTPVKSLSGMAGFGAGVVRKGTLCSQCSDENCLYGRISRGPNNI